MEKLTSARFAILFGGLVILASAPALAQNRVTIKNVDSEIINGPKKACPATVNVTGNLQVKIASTSKPGISVSYQWVRSDGKTIGPSSAVLGPGNRTVKYSWSLSKSYSGSVQLVILSPTKQSAKASFKLDCGKAN